MDAGPGCKAGAAEHSRGVLVGKAPEEEVVMGYIDKEALLSKLAQFAPASYGIVCRLISSLPEESVLKKGYWIKLSESPDLCSLVIRRLWKCSECGSVFKETEDLSPSMRTPQEICEYMESVKAPKDGVYCSACGAKMR